MPVNGYDGVDQIPQFTKYPTYIGTVGNPFTKAGFKADADSFIQQMPLFIQKINELVLWLTASGSTGFMSQLASKVQDAINTSAVISVNLAGNPVIEASTLIKPTASLTNILLPASAPEGFYQVYVVGGATLTEWQVDFTLPSGETIEGEGVAHTKQEGEVKFVKVSANTWIAIKVGKR